MADVVIAVNVCQVADAMSEAEELERAKAGEKIRVPFLLPLAHLLVVYDPCLSHIP
jgi:hypothetical protein